MNVVMPMIIAGGVESDSKRLASFENPLRYAIVWHMVFMRAERNLARYAVFVHEHYLIAQLAAYCRAGWLVVLYLHHVGVTAIATAAGGITIFAGERKSGSSDHNSRHHDAEYNWQAAFHGYSITSMSEMQQQYFPWVLSGFVTLLAIIAWGTSLAWQFSTITTYTFFPLLGLLAFSLMWAHYVVGAGKQWLGQNSNLNTYFRCTSYAVLVCIVLHPGILIYQLCRDGLGLPPRSYERFVAPQLAWLTLLGSVCLLIFLAFELHRWYGSRSWWKYVLSAGDLAMLAIFYHGLRLGTQLQAGWYQVVWWCYGLTLVAVLVHKYTRIVLHKTGVEQTTDWQE